VLRSAPAVSLANAVGSNGPKTKESYPRIRFWNQNNFQGNVKSTDYIEHGDGTPADLTERKAITERLRDFLTEISEGLQGVTIPPFRKLPLSIKDKYFADIEQQFPYLGMCANHWKAKVVWQENFGNWKKYHAPPDDSDIKEVPSQTNRK